MKCPKCGLEQPDSPMCARCGIVVEKYLQRVQIADDPLLAAKTVTQQYASRLGGGALLMAPDIPRGKLDYFLPAYPKEEEVGVNEEILAILDESQIVRAFKANTIITTRRLISLIPGHKGAIYQIDLKDIRNFRSESSPTGWIKINGDSSNFRMHLGAIENAKRPQFLAMMRDLSKAMGGKNPPGAVKPSAMSDYPSIKAEIEAGGDELPQTSSVSMDEDVSGGRKFMGSVGGFLAGAFIGVPIGTFIGAILHFPGRGPWICGLIVGVMVWNGVRAAIVK